MAVFRNTTNDVLSLFSPIGEAVRPGKETSVPDDRAAGLAWPKSTWALVKKPGKGYRDASTDDSHFFLPVDSDQEPIPEAPASSDTEEN